MTYKIQSQQLQDGRWQPAYLPPLKIEGDNVVASERHEFDWYFKTKEEADEFTFDFLAKEGVKEDDIEL